MAITLYRQDGSTVTLTTTIGSGGEGDIYTSPDDPLECAKVYTKAMPHETAAKLALMVRNPPPDPSYQARKHHSICWPTALLYKAPSRREVAGFFMPRIDTKIFQKAFLYIMAEQRRLRFGGGFTWKHLIAAATNIASSVEAIHQRGYCIGDLNESNILIAPNAMISIIDSDSFQVPDKENGKTYRSLVGKGDYSPPEMIGKNFAEIDRTIASDSFSLATILFQLLMEGSHPYRAKGRLVDGASTPESKILLGHFPYAIRNKDIAPPDDAPPFENLHPKLQNLFEQCFATGNKNPSARPTAHDWYSALRDLDHSFKQCPNNANHNYFDHLRSCPWCALQTKSGVDLFPPPVGHQIALDDNDNLLESLDKRLDYLAPYVVMAFADGVLTPEEEAQITAYGKQLQIPPKEIEKLIKAEAARVQGARGQAPGSPQITLSQSSFAFDNVRHGTSLNGRYTITNTGGGTLTGPIRATSHWLKPSQSAVDPTHHIQEQLFAVDTSVLTPGTLNRGAIEITSNGGNVRIEISVSLELESSILKRWRTQSFWGGALLGSVLGLCIYGFAPPPISAQVTNFAGLVGVAAFVAVCAVLAKWGGGIGAFCLATFLQLLFKSLSPRGYSALVWAEIISAFLFFWAKPLLIAKLAGNHLSRIWTVITGIAVVASVIFVGVRIRFSPPQPISLSGYKLPLEDHLLGRSVGIPSGIQWTKAIGDGGAVFSAAGSSRIEYPGLIPTHGTIEFWIKVTSGYRYENFQFKGDQSEAMIFSTDAQGGDVTWPGTTKFTAFRNGDLSLWMATSRYNQPSARSTEARRTQFRFGEWHAIGISYGSQGQYIMLDGKVVASNPRMTQILGASGNHQQPLDVPTIGETVSHYWAHHRYEGGFEGTLAEVRISGQERDWKLAKGINVGTSMLVSTANAVPELGGAQSSTSIPEPEAQSTASAIKEALDVAKSSNQPAESVASGTSNETAMISPIVAENLVLEKREPVYPPIAKAARISGRVILRVQVSEDGIVSNASLVSGPSMLQQAALDSVRQWRFRPYMLNGIPSKFSAMVDVNFSLDSDAARAAPQKPPALPVLLSPPEGAVFHNFPRTTTLIWQPVPGAASYKIEVDFYDPPGWNPAERIAGLRATTFTFNFVGKQRGRWRVWAIDASGREGEKSPWREFEYTI